MYIYIHTHIEFKPQRCSIACLCGRDHEDLQIRNMLQAGYKPHAGT